MGVQCQFNLAEKAPPIIFPRLKAFNWLFPRYHSFLASGQTRAVYMVTIDDRPIICFIQVDGDCGGERSG